MSLILQEGSGAGVRTPTEADRRRISKRFNDAVDAKIASARDPSQHAYQEFAGDSSIFLVYLKHPEEQGKRVVLLYPVGSGSTLIYQFERGNGGIKRTIFGAEDHVRIVSGMLSSDRASLLNSLMTPPWVYPVERTIEVIHLSSTERVRVEARGLRIPDPQPTRE